jgi:PPOX class probable F420-dependent enzyme
MDTADALEFIRANHRGILMTYRGDGGVQASPVTAAVDGTGRVVISSRETAYKVKNLLRDPRSAYCGFGDGFFGPWVQVEGPAEIVHLPEAMDLLVDYYRSVSGEHPDWDDYRKAMEREQRVMIRVTVERAGPNRSG